MECWEKDAEIDRGEPVRSIGRVCAYGIPGQCFSAKGEWCRGVMLAAILETIFLLRRMVGGLVDFVLWLGWMLCLVDR